MTNIRIVSYRQRLDNLFARISAFSEDKELQSEWAKYLCILVSGFLETAIPAVYDDFARQKASPYAAKAKYRRWKLGSFQNPEMGKILKLTKTINPQWADELENATEGKLKDAVNSVVANRNQIAHGKDVWITYESIKDYYEDVVKVVNLIEGMCG